MRYCVLWGAPRRSQKSHLISLFIHIKWLVVVSMLVLKGLQQPLVGI